MTTKPHFDPCPDFDLAPLQAFEPEVFTDPPDKADGLILALALAFNDLKSMMWFIEQLEKGTPAGEPVSPEPYVGQIQGMKVHATRTVLAQLHEVFIAIDAAAKNGTLSSPAFQGALARLGGGGLAPWSDLVDIAAAKAQTDPLRKFLVRVRNNIAFHYYDPHDLEAGYQYYFFERQPTPFNQKAFMSLGPKMELTRFFFADAAAQGHQLAHDPVDANMALANQAVLKVNKALRLLVEAFIAEKIERRSKASAAKSLTN